MEEKLISAVCDLPELYNINLKSYNDLRAKSNAWRSVAKATGMPEDKCKKKWKNLRDTYRREVKRTGANGGPNKWKHSSLLSFLDPFMKELAAGGSMEDGFPPHCSPVSPQSGSDQEQTPPLLQAGPNAAPRRTLRKKAERGGGGGGSNSDEWFEEYAMSVLNKQPDAEESFLLSLAPMLKALPPEKRSLAKIELLTVLHKLQFTPEPTT